MEPHRRGSWLLGLLIAASVLLPASGARAAGSATVREVQVSFSPAQIPVSVGDTVTWVYVSSPPGSGHSVTFQDEDLTPACPALVLDDCQRNASQKVSRTFTAPGTYPYHCKIHQSQGMTGVVVVAAATTTATTRATTTSTVKPSSTSTTARATSSSTTTTRPLATSSTVVRSSTTTSDTSSVLLPGAPPSLSGDAGSAAGGGSGGSGGSDRGAVALIVGLLLAVSAGGGYLLWRLRPGRP
ncbi:MAG TPA: plastocyanin/azurin family copper-binding protein [Acidimicrobiia bacterium]|nr:plastocyanin/azurin family copper-binding protein [Acidimicrobiia bacterium]